jgi:hypothetical protein
MPTTAPSRDVVATRAAERRRRQHRALLRTLGPLVLRCRAFLVRDQGKAADLVRDVLRALLRVLGPTPGVCRVCACSELDPCDVNRTGVACSWADASQTLCTAPACRHQASLEDIRS